MTPGARFFTRGRLLTNLGRVAAVGLWLALFLAWLYLAPIVPKAVLSMEFKDEDDKPCVLAISPDGKTVVTAQLYNFDYAYGPLHFWDVEKKQERFAIAENVKDIDEFQFSPDGKLVGARIRNHGFTVWDSQSGQRRADYIADRNPGHFEFEYARFAPDSSCLVLCYFNVDLGVTRRMALWDIESQQLLKTEAAINEVVFSGDGKEMLVVFEPTIDAATVPIVGWSVSGRQRGTAAKAALEVGMISPDFQSVCDCPRPDEGSKYEIHLLDLTTGHQTDSIRRDFSADEGGIVSPAFFSKAGHFIMQHNFPDGPESMSTAIFRVNPKLVQAVTIKGYLYFSWDDQFLLDRDGTGATFYETAGMSCRGELRVSGDSELGGSGRMYGIPARWEHGTYPFAPDNKTVVLTRLVRSRTSHSALGWLTPYLTTASPTQTVECARLWDVETCTELACFDDCIQALYSPDGKTLATAHTDGKVRLWDVPPRKPVLAVLGMSLVLWLSVLVAIRLWVRITKGRRTK